MIGRTIFTNYENFQRFHGNKLKKNERQSQIIDGERLPSWSLSLLMKIISVIFTTAGDSPNFAQSLSMAFSDLEKRKDKHFLENSLH